MGWRTTTGPGDQGLLRIQHLSLDVWNVVNISKPAINIFPCNLFVTIKADVVLRLNSLFLVLGLRLLNQEVVISHNFAAVYLKSGKGLIETIMTTKQLALIDK